MGKPMSKRIFSFHAACIQIMHNNMTKPINGPSMILSPFWFGWIIRHFLLYSISIFKPRFAS